MSKRGRRPVVSPKTSACEDFRDRQDRFWESVPVPVSVRRLDAAGESALRDLQRVAVEVQQLETRRDELVQRLRGLRVSWSAIGWAVGTSGEAARQRWGVQR